MSSATCHAAAASDRLRPASRRAWRRVVSAATLSAVTLACSGGRSPTSPTPAEHSPTLRVLGPMAILVPGESAQLQAIKHWNGLSADLTRSAVWTSSEPSVVTVSPGGLALAVGPGQAVVSASAESLVSTIGVRVTAVHELLAGRIDPEVAADIIAQNQDTGIGGNKHRGIITRFELPIRVYVDSAFVRVFGADCAQRGAAPWQSSTNLPLLFVNDKVEPRVQVITLTTGDNRARTFIDSVNLDNSLRVVSLIIPTPWGFCDEDTVIHEFGHVLGIKGHPEWGGVMAYVYGPTGVRRPSARELRLVTELHKLPLGAHLESDGTWTVQ
jgi:hypothetical protein